MFMRMLMLAMMVVFMLRLMSMTVLMLAMV